MRGHREPGQTRSVDPTAAYVSFAVNGFAVASWASRIPQVRAHFHLSPANLGLVLLTAAAGTFVTLPFSGVLIQRLGSRGTVFTIGLLAGVALTLVALGYVIGLPLVVMGLFSFGVAVGAWDPAQNVQAAVMERALQRSLMPRFHAAFSVGTVAGAAVGVGMVAWRVPVTLHFLGVAALVGMAVPWAATRFRADITCEPTTAQAATPSLFRRWLEPRALVIGLLVLAFAFTEGTGNDWIGVAVIDGYHAPAVLGTIALAVFLAGMTAARWFGSTLLDRYGRPATVRALACVAMLGVLLFAVGQAVPIALLGVFLWGVGASLGFPAGMSAAADDPAAAAGRVSVVASIGYLAFLGGPPFVGFLGNHVTVLHALIVVVGVLLVSTLLAGALRPPRSDSDEPAAPAGVARSRALFG